MQHITENGQRRPPKNKVDIFDTEKEKLISHCNQLKESSLRYRLEGVSKIWDFCRYFKVNFKSYFDPLTNADTKEKLLIAEIIRPWTREVNIWKEVINGKEEYCTSYETTYFFDKSKFDRLVKNLSIAIYKRGKIDEEENKKDC